MRKRWMWIAIIGCGLLATAAFWLIRPTVSARFPASIDKIIIPDNADSARPQKQTTSGDSSPNISGAGGSVVFSPDGSILYSGSTDPQGRLRDKSHPEEHREPTDEDLLEASLNRLKKGNLAYSTPEKMKMAQTEHVTARIGSPEVSVQALQSDLPSGTNRAVAAATTPVSPRMKMELKSADFDITPLSSEEQAVGGDTPTTWEWDIAAKHSGKSRLHLAAVVELKNLSRDFTSIDRDITVQVDTVDAVSAFVKANWQWIIATLTAVGGGAWKLIKDRKKPAESASTAGDAST
jgi:hypothetical protein